MKSNINEHPLRLYSQVPEIWNLLEGGQDPSFRKRSDEFHSSQGWKLYVRPAFDPDTEFFGELIYDPYNDVVTNEVGFLSPEQIEERQRNQAISEAQAAREEAIRLEQERVIMDQKQAIEDDEEALENQAFFPLWQDFEEGHTFTVGFMVQDFEGIEMKLWRTLQLHQKQDNWFPANVPALFVKVLAEGAPLVWEAGIQVTVGEEYLYQPNGNTYIVVQSHTTQIGWEPPNVPSLWQLKV